MQSGRSRIHLLLVVCGSLLALLLLEAALRTLAGGRPALQDVRSQFYAYDERYGWLPIPNKSGIYYGYRKTKVRHNNAGFRDREHGEKQKPRIAFFGDSFVWGYDSERDERFTDLIQAKVPDWDVLNFGVSGFGTDQEFLLLQEVFPAYRPDRVVLIFTGHNDFKDNSSNVQAVYMKPYFEMFDGKLALRGVPVPKTWVYYFQAGPFSLLRRSKLVEDLAQIATHLRAERVPDPTRLLLRSFHQYVEESGAKFMLGLVDNTPRVFKWCEQDGYECLGLQNQHVYPAFGKHWNAEGNREVAERLLEMFQAHDWLVSR